MSEESARQDRDDRDDQRSKRSGPRRDGNRGRQPRRFNAGGRDRGERSDRGERGQRGERGSDRSGPNWTPREKRGPQTGGPRRRGPREPRREGGRTERPQRFDRRDDRSGARREWKPRGEGRDERRRDDRRGPRRFDRDERHRDDQPQTEAQRRRSEVFARKGPRKYGKDKPFADRVDNPERVVDEGSVRSRRFDGRSSVPAAKRARPRRDGSPFPPPPALEDALAREVRKAVGDRRVEYVSRQLSRALVAYDAERYREAMGVLRPVLEDLWLINEVRVLAGRLEYRAQHWKSAAEHLEFARGSDRTDMTNMPVLIDCYRALRRYDVVEQLWNELKESSPHPAIMAEGRVSAAMSHADRGDVQTAIRIMTHGSEPRHVQPYHLLEWYVLGDLYDRAGDQVTAKKMFAKVARNDAEYFDVASRLAGLGE